MLGINQMHNDLYFGEIINSFHHEMVSLEFSSPVKGWLSEVVVKTEDLQEDRAEYTKGVNRIQQTTDGGKTWRMIYESPRTLIKQLHYMNGTNELWGVKSVYQKGQFRPHFMLYKSPDEGVHWDKVCELPVPYAIDGFTFFDEPHGYVWTLTKIFATSTGGKQWQLLTPAINPPSNEELINPIGPDQFMYFITRQIQEVKGINPWKKQELNLELPDLFEPQNVLADPAHPTVYVIGQIAAQWQLLGYEQEQLSSQETVPIRERDFMIDVFAYGDNVINLVGLTTRSFLSSYYFYVRDVNGWHKEHPSGKKGFEHMVYWGNHAWAIRIALLKGYRELWRRRLPALE